MVYWQNGVTTQPPWDMGQHRADFANFLYTKDQILADEQTSGFGVALKELQAALVIQRAFRKKKGHYYVRVGDSLDSIAQKHGVSEAAIRAWNGLSGDHIRPGELLIVTQPEAVPEPSGPAKPVSVKDRIEQWENRTKP